MSDYLCMARSNYFQVKDVAAFLAAFAHLPVDIQTESGHRTPTADYTGRVGVFPRDDSYPPTGFTFWMDDEEDGTDGQVALTDVLALIAPHLAANEVAVLHEIGHEKLRYLTAVAGAVNCEGVQQVWSMDDFYQVARTLGSQVTAVAD